MQDKQQSDVKVKIQRFGSHLSGMIMPNIGAFIAWESLPRYLSRQAGCQTRRWLHWWTR